MTKEGLFITFEGTEGAGKSTQIKFVAERLTELGRSILSLREPGGTPLGEEIRHLLKHSHAGAKMCPEAELLLMNASRAQLVREVIQPALKRGDIVLCDRFFDSTVAYQGFGRGLDQAQIERINEFAVCGTRPDLTLLLRVPIEVSEARRASRQPGSGAMADRFEDSDRGFFERVEKGYDALAATGGARVRVVDATQKIETVAAEIWKWVEQLVTKPNVEGERAFKTVGEYRKVKPY
jgi:dTMP kinase